MKEFFIKLSLAGVAALAPIHAVMITVGVLIFADLFTGIWAATRRNETISSAVMRRTISKLILYQIAIVSGWLLEFYILESVIPITKLVASIIGMVEFKSILENVTSITGVKFKDLIKKLGSDNDRK